MENGYNTGEIKHPERFNQPLLFKGMSRGKLSPTDIDAVFEYKDKGYIFYEVKHKSVKNIPLGQDILFVRLAKRLRKSGILVFVVVCEHDIPTGEPIVLADTKIRSVFVNLNAEGEQEWRKPKHDYTAKQFQNKVLDNNVFDKFYRE